MNVSSGIGRGQPAQAGRTRGGTTARPVEPAEAASPTRRERDAEENRALVPVLAGGPGREHAGRPSAAFVTQLIAHRLDLPHTRARRRETPDVATAAYGAGPSRVRRAGLRLDAAG